MSPSASCAYSVMPTVTVPSASRRTHSWDSVYFRSAGMFMWAPGSWVDSSIGVLDAGQRSGSQDFTVAHERQLDDGGGQSACRGFPRARCRRRPRPSARAPGRSPAACVGLKVPLVISPSRPEAAITFWCARSTPPFSRRIRPTNCAFWPLACRAALPMKSRSETRSMVQARPASSGLTVSSMSWPYRFMPASRRSVSRAPRPAGLTPAATSAFHSASACVAGTPISKPSSPV